jgi:hypothetical protein
MKKLLLSTFAILTGIALSAQVSVWDGSYEPFDSIHAGSVDDPILIENAAQLAYMSKMSFCGADLKYWKLTVDIDLDNLEWNPIGHIDFSNCPEFDGYFDGDNHSIYNVSHSLFYYTYNGYIKNISVRNSDVNIQNRHGDFGVVAPHVPLIENCHNYGNITIDGTYYSSIGGVAGYCDTIINCSNHGTITVVGENSGYLYVGGVAGEAFFADMVYNSGDLHVEAPDFNNCRVGGVCAMIYNTVSNSYNIANVDVNDNDSYVGGIAGDIKFYTASPYHDNISINNCYNAGNINAINPGGILAKTDYNNVVINVGNSYYINSIQSINGYGTPKSESEMKSAAFVSLLNNGGDVYAFDELGTNNGYPIFAQYYAIDENETDNGLAVFPNPTSGIITINSESLAHVEVVNIFGQTVIKEHCSGGNITIDLAEQPAGIYFLNLTDDKGKMSVKKVMKE